MKHKKHKYIKKTIRKTNKKVLSNKRKNKQILFNKSKKQTHRRRLNGGNDNIVDNNPVPDQGLVYSSNNFEEIVRYISYITYNKNHERCGSVNIITNNTHSPIYQVYLHKRMTVGSNRPNCLYDTDYNHFIIWHNHPYESKFYPSVEDILKVIKIKNKFQQSLIITKFGYWDMRTINHIDTEKDPYKKPNSYYTALYDEIVNTYHYKYDKNDNNLVGKQKCLTDVIRLVLDNIYFETSKGREYKKNVVDKAIYILNNKVLANILSIQFFYRE